MRALIIEDETLIAKGLKDRIESIAADVQVIEILPSFKTAKKWFLQNAEPDLIFMDIQLSDGVSFELFDVYELKCPVIFTTAYDEYAIRAFKVNGVDYLLKPVEDVDLKKAIDKCRNIIENKTTLPFDIHRLVENLKDQKPASLYKEKFIVNVRNTWIPVNVADIACFVRDQLIYLYTFSGEKYILEFTTLDEIEELLDSRIFYRANRQFIIHIDSIQNVKPFENSKLKLTFKQPLKFDVDISREKAPAFKRWLDR